jgi:hypothetical protein
MKICVIGAGTYGSYVIDSLLSKYPNAKIDLLDVGDSSIKSESQIGYFSSLKKEIYTGLTDGRFFGFGGASTKWGGQLLTFSENDFAHPDLFMQDIIKLDIEHKKSMLKKFNIENNYPENHIADDLFTKTGVWLSVFNRNFFKIFKISKRKNVNIIAHSRVSRLFVDEKNSIQKVGYIQNGIEKEATYDYYFLTAGAFETARILLSSGITKEKVGFSDHLSQKVFKIKKSTLIGDEDYVFRMKGFSLITKRMIGEINGCSFYAHPVFNMDFPFFQSIKTILFKKQFTWEAIKGVFVNIPQIVAFVWSVLIKKRMFVLNNEWFIYIDIENPTKESFVALSKEKDVFGLQGLDVYYNIGEEAEDVYEKSKELVEKHLKDKGVVYEVVSEKIEVRNSEDIYHPYGMYCDYASVDDYFNRYDNMLVVSTGILSRSGGINPTAALLPLIDEFVNVRFKYNK